MTDHQKTLLELNQYRNRFSHALKAAHICVFEVDLRGQLYTFFENAEDIFGVPGERILKEVERFRDLPPEKYKRGVSEYFTHPQDWDTVDKAFRSIYAGQPATYQARMKAGNTNYIWCKVDVTPVLEDGIPVRMVGTITDIDKLKLEMEQLEIRATVDAFTGLYSKKYTEELITKTLEEFSEKRHSLMILDLDDFKKLNDTYGHTAGDDVIKAVAVQLKGSVRANDIVGRLGGDEFGVFIKDIHKASELMEIAKRLLKTEGLPFQVTKSIGISVYPRDGYRFRTLYEKADQALYRAKKRKNTYIVYKY